MKTTFRLCPTDGLKVKKVQDRRQGLFRREALRCSHEDRRVWRSAHLARDSCADRLRGKDVRHIRISSVNSYWAVDGSRNGNELSFVNHSCRAQLFQQGRQ